MKKIFIIICLIFSSVFFSGWSTCETVKIELNNGIYHIILKGDKVAKKIKFIASDKLITNKDIHVKLGALLTVNTGFFDPKNQKTISYIVSDSVTVADPLFNENLLSNPILRQNIEKIVNRSEFRVINCDGKYYYDIVSHNAPVDFTCSIETSAQGGPLLIPDLRLEEEFFLVKKNGNIIRESASVLEKTARTAIGLKKNGNVDDIHILIVTNDNPKTIYELRDLCRDKGLYKAMAFDGGSSTSLNYKKSIDIVSTQDASGRLLKSFLVLIN